LILNDIPLRKLLVVAAGLLVIGFMAPDDLRGFESSFDEAVLMVRAQQAPAPSSDAASSPLISPVTQRFWSTGVIAPIHAIPLRISACIMRC